MTLGAVCAIGLGFSAATARPSASAVLTYLVVVALVAGTPLATAISSTAVRGEQQRIIYLTDYDASTNNRKVCRSEPEVQTTDVEHVERIWWMLIPNPFAALSDVAVRAPASEDLWRHPGGAILTGTGDTIDEMRNPQPSELVVNYCDDNDDNGPDSDDGSLRPTRHLVFWPATLLVMLGLGGWSTAFATRRLRTPARTLARGTRVA